MLRLLVVVSVAGLLGGGVAEARRLVGKGVKGGAVAGVVTQGELGRTDPFDHLRFGVGVFLHVRGGRLGPVTLDGQAELQLTWKGGRIPDEPPDMGVDGPEFDLGLFYLELPLLLRVGLADHVWLLVGPAPAYYAGGFLHGNGIFAGDGTEGVDYPAPRLYFGGVVALGFSTGAAGRGFGLEARWVAGPSEIGGYGEFDGLQTYSLLVSYEFE